MPAPRHARPAPRPRPRSACRGLTVIEMAVTLGVAAVLLGTAVPAFQDFRLRREVEAVAAQLETDLQLARAEAVARNEDVRVSFASGAGGSCYVVHAGPAGSCRCTAGGAVDCSPGDEALRVVALPVTVPVQLQSRSANILFDPVKGTVTPTTTVRVVAAAGELRQVVNVVGRVRTCSPGPALAGYPRC